MDRTEHKSFSLCSRRCNTITLENCADRKWWKLSHISCKFSNLFSVMLKGFFLRYCRSNSSDGSKLTKKSNVDSELSKFAKPLSFLPITERSLISQRLQVDFINIIAGVTTIDIFANFVQKNIHWPRKFLEPRLAADVFSELKELLRNCQR